MDGAPLLGPEHLVLGVLRDGGSGTSQILEANGVNLIAARAELRRLAQRGLVPGPRPSDAELLHNLGIDVATIGRADSMYSITASGLPSKPDDETATSSAAITSGASER